MHRRRSDHFLRSVLYLGAQISDLSLGNGFERLIPETKVVNYIQSNPSRITDTQSTETEVGKLATVPSQKRDRKLSLPTTLYPRQALPPIFLSMSQVDELTDFTAIIEGWYTLK